MESSGYNWVYISVRVHVLEKAEKVKTAAELVTEAATLA